MTMTATKATMPRALVVDDSKLARATLSKMLREEKIEVDTADSAESALEYLSTTKPDVVFLDQNMPGMNGLDALKVIKANPATATIPVMMYTSETAGVYMSQARALGAFDVLVKDDLKTVDIRRRLQELRLRPSRPSVSRPLHVVNENSTEQESSAAAKEDVFTAQQRQHLQRMIRQEQAYWNEEQDQREVRLRIDNSTTEKPADFEPTLTTAVPPRRYSRLWPMAFVLLGAGLLTWLILANQRQVQQESVAIASESQTIQTETQATTPPSARVQETAAPVEKTVDVNALLAALEWAVSQRMEYPFDEQPLAGDRLIQLQTMLTYLSDADFKGEIQLLVQHGNFCLTSTSDGGHAMPAGNTPFRDCKVVERDASSTSDMQSVEFALFVNSSPLANGDRGIRVSTGTGTNTKPLVGYPVENEELTAGEWNKIAARNNHIAVKLLADK